MREIRTSGSTRGRRAADLICYSSSYSTGHSFFGWTRSHRPGIAIGFVNERVHLGLAADDFHARID